MRGPVHGATTGGYPFWVFTVIFLVLVTLTLGSGKFYPLFHTGARPIERRRQPGAYWLRVAIMLAVMVILISAAIWCDRHSSIAW